MKKRHIRRHHKHEPLFEGGEEHSSVVVTQERLLTAEGYKRRQQAACDTRPRAIYRGRRQGKRG